jgi:hypothetical protein
LTAARGGKDVATANGLSQPRSGFPRPDRKLAAQLCGVRFTIGPNGIAAEDEIAVIKGVGRSPDKADAIAMCWCRGVTGGWQRRIWGQGDPARTRPKVVCGHMAKRRR